MPLISSGQNPERLAHWFQSAACQRVLAIEQRAMIPLLTAHIGVRGMFLRAAEPLSADLSGNMLQHVCRLFPCAGRLAGDLDCEDDQLPLATESLNLAFVQHGLEQASNWPGLIAELARCLQPEGVLMLTVFSRFSLWRSRWQGLPLQAINRHSVTRCCENVGLQVEERLAIGPVWPLPLTEQPGVFGAGPLHTSWALLLRKRRHGMTPVGLRRNVMFKPDARPT